MKEFIKQITPDNTEAFLKQYGRIGDKSLAIEAIIINPYALAVLDPSLSCDPEVLIYWYPMTVTKIDDFNSGLMEAECGIIDENDMGADKYWYTRVEITPPNRMIRFSEYLERTSEIYPSHERFGSMSLDEGINFSNRYTKIFHYLIQNSPKKDDSSDLHNQTTYTINRTLIEQAVQQFGENDKELKIN